jgi:sulfonate dioxygenase
MATVATISQNVPSLNLSASMANGAGREEAYAYAHLLPTFDSVRFPPLTPFRHEDPGRRALSHSDPNSFLRGASRVHELTPTLGSEIDGVNLARLSPHERDQLALFVAHRGLVVFRGQEEFINSGTDRYLEWGRYFGRLHVHPTSGHPSGVPEIHLVYRDKNSPFNFESDDSATSTQWHSEVSYELQPPGLTTFFLLSQRE